MTWLGYQMQVVLIDGVQLGRLMIDCNVGVSAERSFTLKRIDSDFFDNAG